MRALALVMVLLSSAAYADSVATIRADVPKLDARKRGKLATSIKPALEGLGRSALNDLIAAANEPRDPSWTESAVLAWRVSVLEALASLKDPRARGAFELAIADENAHFLVQRAAAEGYAKLGEYAMLEALIGRDAVVAGIGSLRTPQVARLLAAELAKRPGPARAKLLAKALGEVGNAWAWKTLPVNLEAELQTRNAAAAALVDAYVAYDGEVRQAASNALLVVDAPATPALIAQAKASSRKVADLEALAERVAKNPLR